MDSFDWSAAETGSRKSQGLLGVGMANFQGVREFQVVPIAPITLIYGQNSAGKSSIQDALTLFRCLTIGSKDTKQMLDRWSRNENIEGLEFRRMTISAFCRSPGPDWYSYWGWEPQGETSLEFAPRNSAWLSTLFPRYLPFAIHINISRQREVDVFSSVNIDIDFGGKVFANVEIHGSKTVIKFSKEHPLYGNFELVFGGPNHFELAMNDVALGVKSQKHWLVVKMENPVLTLERGLQNFCFNWRHSDPKKSGMIIDEHRRENAKDFLVFLVAGISYCAGESCYCPDVPPVRKMLTEQDAVFDIAAREATTALNTLKECGSLGAEYVARYTLGINEPSAYRDGILWWEILARLALDINSDNLESSLERISDALGSPTKLDTGYRLSAIIHHIVEESFLLKPSSENQPGFTEDILGKFDKRVKLFLLEKDGNQVRFDDVGSGVSQIIPVLVAIYSQKLVYLHQPELHLHPRLQAQLADVFVECINPKRKEETKATATKLKKRYTPAALLKKRNEFLTFLAKSAEKFRYAAKELKTMSTIGRTDALDAALQNLALAAASITAISDARNTNTKTIFIESHSEHLLLRILKRIRQTNDGAEIPAELRLLPNQVSVIYVDRDEEHGTIFKPLRISRTGEFMDRWPHGFFADREQELFDE